MTLKVDSIAGEDGTSPVTLTGQSASKAWARYDQAGTVEINKSINASSITDNSTGDADINVTNALADANSVWFGGIVSGGGFVASGSGTETTKWGTYVMLTSSGAASDLNNVGSGVMGDLA